MSSVSAGASSLLQTYCGTFVRNTGTPVSSCNTEGVAYVKSLELEALDSVVKSERLTT